MRVCGAAAAPIARSVDRILLHNLALVDAAAASLFTSAAGDEPPPAFVNESRTNSRTAAGMTVLGTIALGRTAAEFNTMCSVSVATCEHHVSTCGADKCSDQSTMKRMIH